MLLAHSRLACGSVLLSCWVAASAQGLPSTCGPLANAIGPFDFRKDKDKLPIVESAHFPTHVELLIRGNGGYLGGDIDYTLRAFPNHHRALVSMMRYGERVKQPQAPNAKYTVECYFMRALAFQPDDTTVRMIFATFLSTQARTDEALAQLSLAERDAGDNAFTHYNLGLLYFDLKDFARASRQAQRAAELGFPRSALKERLVETGNWVEPQRASLPSVGSPAPAASAP